MQGGRPCILNNLTSTRQQLLLHGGCLKTKSTSTTQPQHVVGAVVEGSQIQQGQKEALRQPQQQDDCKALQLQAEAAQPEESFEVEAADLPSSGSGTVTRQYTEHPSSSAAASLLEAGSPAGSGTNSNHHPLAAPDAAPAVPYEEFKLQQVSPARHDSSTVMTLTSQLEEAVAVNGCAARGHQLQPPVGQYSHSEQRPAAGSCHDTAHATPGPSCNPCQP